MQIQSLLSIIQLIVDLGLVVLIWMVQLIVYPSFLYYQKKNLLHWHQKYTNRIAIIVVPLMLIQLILAAFFIYLEINFKNALNLLIVVFLWVYTFTSFAPLHFKISEGKFENTLLKLLVKRNWYRTTLWTILFLINFMYFIMI